jgi:hypothetical protein
MSCEVIKKTWEFALSHVTQCQFKTSVGLCVYVMAGGWVLFVLKNFSCP